MNDSQVLTPRQDIATSRPLRVAKWRSRFARRYSEKSNHSSASRLQQRGDIPREGE